MLIIQDKLKKEKRSHVLKPRILKGSQHKHSISDTYIALDVPENGEMVLYV